MNLNPLPSRRMSNPPPPPPKFNPPPPPTHTHTHIHQPTTLRYIPHHTEYCSRGMNPGPHQ